MKDSFLLLHFTQKHYFKNIYDFKNHTYPAGTVFQVDVKTPRNLKPSLIRWRYVNEVGQEVYMNIFDHPVIKTAFDKKGDLDATHRKAVQKVLDDLHRGFFTLDNFVMFSLKSSNL